MDIAFHRPESLNETLELLAQYGEDAKVLAGGTALVLMLRQGLVAPRVLVSLERIAGLNDISVGSEGLALGPLVPLHSAATSTTVRDTYPALAHCYDVVGNIRVRYQATAGGNLAEADYSSDPPTMLLALDAQIEVAGPGGTRSIPMSEFVQGAFATALSPEEVLTGIRVPSAPDGARMRYRKFVSRASEDRTCVGVGVVAAFDGERCRELRVAVGATCEAPVRLKQIEQQAQGQALTDGVIRDVAQAYATQLDVIEDVRGSEWYRRKVTEVEVRRALEEVRDGHR